MLREFPVAGENEIDRERAHGRTAPEGGPGEGQ
jgi:hypothetical protein